MRPLLEGFWLSQVDGWRVDIGGAGSWTHESFDHPFADISLELDGIGCLASATLPLTRPLGLKPYSGLVTIWALGRDQGWVELAVGLIKEPLDHLAELSQLTLEPLENLVMRDYYSGAVPPDIEGVTVSSHNLLTSYTPTLSAPSRSTSTNDQVIGDLLRGDSTATIGVDAERRIIIARPTDGSPVEIAGPELYDRQPSSYEFPDIASATRIDPGLGWRKREHRIDRGPYVPRVAVQSEAAQFREDVYGYGPALVNAKLFLRQGYIVEEQEDFRWYGQDFRQIYVADGGVCVLVYDMQEWYQKSALYGQDLSTLETWKKNVDTALLLVGQRAAWYGEDHQFTQEAKRDLVQARAYYNAALSNRIIPDSDYEPLTAMLSLGLKPRSISFSSLEVSWVIWLSRLDWDEECIGISDTFDDQYGLLHPKGQKNTLKILLSTINNIDLQDGGQPVQPTDLKIPEEIFRQNNGPRLAQTIYKEWLDKFDGEPPPDEKPPKWDGRWYMHVGCSWDMPLQPQ